MTRGFKVALGVVLAGVLLVGVFHDVDLPHVWQTLRSARPGWLLAAVALAVFSYVVRAWQWGALLEPLAKVRQRDLISAIFVGFAANLVVPRSGEVLRPWLVTRRHGMKLSSGLAVILVERLIDMLAILALFSLYLFVLPRPAAHADTALTQALEAAVAAAAGMALLVLLALAVARARRRDAVALAGTVVNRLPPSWAVRVRSVLAGFGEGLAILGSSPGHLARVAALSLLLWTLSAMSLHCVQRAFGIDVPAQAAFLVLAFLVVGESIPTPGLIGGFHAFYVLALTGVLGVDRADATAAALTAHLVTNLPVLVIGAALLGREGLGMKRALDVRADETTGRP